MKYKTILSLASVLSISAVMSGVQPVLAADKNATSQANVEVTAPTDGTHPPIIGPGDPNNPGTGQTGPLTLDYVSNFDFGKIEVSAQPQEVALAGPTDSDGKIVAQGVQVTDLRGTGVGWKVNVQLSEFKGITSDTNKLKGAELTLPQGNLVTHNESQTEGAPQANAVTLEAGGAAKPVFQASEDQGMGTWANQWEDQAIKLKVPSAPKVDKYAATFTATLSDTPA